MIPIFVQEALEERYGSYVRPFLWYSGENKELLAREISAIAQSGAKEFVFENRGGDWFGTDFWWDIFGFVLEYAKSLNMRVWSIDDSHVNTGSANDTLAKPENAKFRPKNVRLDMVDAVGPLLGGAFSLPGHTDQENIIQISAFRRDMQSGHSYGQALDLTGCVQDGLLVTDLPEGVWRIYYVMTTDPARHGLFANYISMVSKESCRHLIDEIHEKMYEHFADYFGNTFAGFFSDEPGFGNCDGQYGPNAYNLRCGQLDKMFPWWDDFPQRLSKLTGMSEADVMLMLPALWDEVDGVSAKLRLDYMDLISALWQENFCDQLGQWCEAHQVEYIGHNLEDADAHMRSGWGCGHYFRSMHGQHMSGMDIVFEQLMPALCTVDHAMNVDSRTRSSSFYHYTLPKLAASMAHITPHMQNRALSEMFGATGWTCGLSNMRSLFNHTLICGVNNYVPHAYAMAIPQVFEAHKERENAAGSVTPPGYSMTYLAPTFYTGGYNPQYPEFCNIIRGVQRISHLTSTAQHLPDVAVYYNAEGDWMNSGACRSMDDVSMSLIRGGFDFDFLPLDTLLNDATVVNGQLKVNNELFQALVLPMSETVPQKLLDKLIELADSKVKICFTDQLPLRTENGAIMPEKMSSFHTLHYNELASELAAYAQPYWAVTPAQEDLRRYNFRDNTGREGVILLNSGAADITFDLPANKNLVFEPYGNQVYALNSSTMTLEAQQLVVVYAKDDPEDLEPYPMPPANWQNLDLRYNIFVRSAVEKEFKLLRADSAAVNLLVEEKLSRFCGEFRYESTFECDSDNCTMLEIPHAGDGARVIINGIDCGFAFGPCCRFNIRKAVKRGVNTLQIICCDNPAYADRPGNQKLPHGCGFPLRAHGFTGSIKIG